ncbi:uncharacterized protein FOMMEDRAFT_133178 [Fomitiporia mediterranea MF3/22]|uniref:uncharacterized protein n=1 Tax=Fomitiporia mediterranea (strain MF3/22) TaxID=694068 RepID=UPI0004407AE5|nr:uncharacterized protein FOMMEDRAFT_133178 [Fomitiporia mediterranea MF3/22]EJD03799.1 hypothetical protein FOMMEDRAFT_133178 [Fomitiporia mediterranea MF3/22]
MSSQTREPMWFCHECQAEMHPLMIPDPHCASCQGTFVEKMENPADDPRDFHNAGPDFNDALGPLGIIASFNELLRESARSQDGQRSTGQGRSSSPINRREFRFEFGSPNSRRHLIIGGPNVLNRRESEQNGNASNARRSGSSGSSPPRMSDFLRANSEASGASEPRDMNIPGQLMAQYMMAVLGGATLGGPRGMSPFFGPMGMDDHGPGDGRWGDYVFTQEALDQLITQMMEGANSTRPVPATEEIMGKLPREVLEEGSELLGRDCAVCKEQFNAKADDPDEQVVVTLPCKHPFHEGCIMPWLKSSGTCPVCRYALVPQPNSHPSGSGSLPDRPGSGSPGPPGGGSSSQNDPGSNASSSNNAPSSSNNSSSNNDTSSPLGFLASLFGGHGRRNSNGSSSHSRSPPRDSQQRRTSGGSGNGNNSSSGNSHIPGSWGED